jgi:PhoPQ-activated pathogenicity-related protein
MMDPYTYRQQLTLPKLLIHGTNDRYWVVDALKNYWGDLVGPKYVLQVPNAGHDLNGGRDLALSTLGVFFRHAASGETLPQIEWRHGRSQEGALRLELRSDVEPKGVRLWTAHAPTKDFREAKWSPQPVPDDGERFVAVIPRPAEGHVAFYGELQFEHEGLPYSLCTTIRRE